MMVASSVDDVIRSELLHLPDSTPPQQPSWSSSPAADAVSSSVSPPLRSISDVDQADEQPGPAIDAAPTILARVRMLHKRHGPRRSFGLALGVLVPLSLALITLMVMSRSRQPAKHADNEQNSVPGTVAKRRGGNPDAALTEHVDASSKGTQLRGPVERFGSSKSSTAASFNITDNVTNLHTDRPMSREVIEERAIVRADIVMTTKMPTPAVVPSAHMESDAETSPAILLDVPVTDSLAKATAPSDTLVYNDAQPSFRGAIAPREEISVGTRASFSATRKSLPWYSYVVYVFSFMTGIAWVALMGQRAGYY